MVKFLIISKKNEGVEMKDLAPFLIDEAIAGWNLQKRGVIRDLNYIKGRPGVVIILECKDEEEARKEMLTLPLVEKKLISYELMELKPYTGLERLFTKKED